MKKAPISLSMLLALPVISVYAFSNHYLLEIPACTSRRVTFVRPLTSLPAKRNKRREPNNDRKEDDLGQDSQPPMTSPRWKLKNDFDMFLNQRTIQSFAFLLKRMRDPQTVLWIENFTQPDIDQSERPSGSIKQQVKSMEDMVLPLGGSDDCFLLNYHGLHAMNTTIFPTWESFFQKMIASPIEKYIVESNSPFVPDYELEINPTRLSNRLIAVREQIAREFAHDLQVLSRMGDETLEAYWTKIHQIAKKVYEDPDSKDGREIKIEPCNLMFLDLSPDDSMGLSSSPLRKGNFDLLKLLATEEAIQRLLNDPKRQRGAGAVSNQYLQDFYSTSLSDCFQGNQEYGRADDLVHRLLASSPVLRQVQGMTALVDPTRLAELVLETRKQVSLEWKAMAQMVPDKHLVVRRLQLDQLLASVMGEPGTKMASFEQALKQGSGSTDTSKTMQLTPPPSPRLTVSNRNKRKVNRKNGENSKSNTSPNKEPIMTFVNVTSVFE